MKINRPVFHGFWISALLAFGFFFSGCQNNPDTAVAYENAVAAEQPMPLADNPYLANPLLVNLPRTKAVVKIEEPGSPFPPTANEITTLQGGCSRGVNRRRARLITS